MTFILISLHNLTIDVFFNRMPAKSVLPFHLHYQMFLIFQLKIGNSRKEKQSLA